MGRHLTEFNNLRSKKEFVSEKAAFFTYINVELALIDAEDIVVLPIITELN